MHDITPSISDFHFDYCRTPQDSVPRVRETKQLARSFGRTIQVWIPASIVRRRLTNRH
jgi:hypothetical protein